MVAKDKAKAVDRLEVQRDVAALAEQVDAIRNLGRVTGGVAPQLATVQIVDLSGIRAGLVAMAQTLEQQRQVANNLVAFQREVADSVAGIAFTVLAVQREIVRAFSSPAFLQGIQVQLEAARVASTWSGAFNRALVAQYAADMRQALPVEREVAPATAEGIGAAAVALKQIESVPVGAQSEPEIEGILQEDLKALADDIERATRADTGLLSTAQKRLLLCTTIFAVLFNWYTLVPEALESALLFYHLMQVSYEISQRKYPDAEK